MPSPISPLGIHSPVILDPAPRSGPAGEFQSALTQAIRQVDEFQQNAGQSVARFLSGESEEVHQTVLEVQKAELAFEMFLQVRNKVVQAYQEIMRLQM